MKRLIPDYYCKSIFDIPLSFFKDNNIKYVFSDLDNTLDGHNIYYPTPRVFKLVNDLKKVGISIIVFSNNKEKRVKDYSTPLEVDYMYRSFKPFKGKLIKYLRRNAINKNEVLIVGDQLMTDVKVGKNANVKVMLTDTIVQSDQFVTRFNRFIDNIFRKRMKKKGILQAKEVK